jgi:hypothetical protein
MTRFSNDSNNGQGYSSKAANVSSAAQAAVDAFRSRHDSVRYSSKVDMSDTYKSTVSYRRRASLYAEKSLRNLISARNDCNKSRQQKKEKTNNDSQQI